MTVPPEERAKQVALAALMRDWKLQVARHQVLWRDDGKLYSGDTFFASDGFLPYYFSQKCRALFIARETRYIARRDNMDVILEKCRKEPWRITSESVLRRMLMLAYGLQQRSPVSYDTLDWVTLCREVGTATGFSFALMELSKYSNESDDGDNADTGLMRSFFEHSCLEKRNFVQEELSLLDPQLVVTMNLWDGKVAGEYLTLALGDVPFIDQPHPSASRRTITINAHPVPLIDLYHFAARKDDKEDYYDPVMRLR
jgi:hypothetical protein